MYVDVVSLSDEGRMSMRQERMLGVALIVAGLVIAGVAVTRMGPQGTVHAQATPQPPVTGGPLPSAPVENAAPPIEGK